jgi:hypothetical protein
MDIRSVQALATAPRRSHKQAPGFNLKDFCHLANPPQGGTTPPPDHIPEVASTNFDRESSQGQVLLGGHQNLDPLN